MIKQKGSSSPKIGVFIQVRLDSSRLPRKALLRLEDLTVIEHALRNLKLVPAHEYALLTDSASAVELAPLAEKWGFYVFEGPQDDVLKRYAMAVEHFGVDYFIRATGDNPLVGVHMARRSLEEALNAKADYFAYQGAPHGSGVEVVNAQAILKARDEAQNPYEREHVCPYLYGHPELFNLLRPPAEPSFSGSERLTLDTPEDYQSLQHIFEELYRGKPLELTEVLNYMRGQK